MLFSYRAIDKDGHEREGTVEALSMDVAVGTLQRRSLIVSSIEPANKKNPLGIEISFFSRVSNKEIVILSRQIATLFEAQVSALRIFRLLAAEVDNKHLAEILTQVADDIQGGSPIGVAHADGLVAQHVHFHCAGVHRCAAFCRISPLISSVSRAIFDAGPANCASENSVSKRSSLAPP